MYLINTNLEEVSKEFDFVDSWIETICESILHKEKEKCKITIFYDYGYFVTKGKGADTKQYEMLFDDRLNYEMSKVRVNINIKIDDSMMSNRLKKGLIPDVIKSMVTEITKYKMQIECDFHENKEVRDSIPAYDESILSVEIIKNEINTEKIEADYFDLDEILDNISKNGVDSLTEKEKEFLDKKSKEM
jgi:hypothetical protein